MISLYFRHWRAVIERPEFWSWARLGLTSENLSNALLQQEGGIVSVLSLVSEIDSYLSTITLRPLLDWIAETFSHGHNKTEEERPRLGLQRLILNVDKLRETFVPPVLFAATLCKVEEVILPDLFRKYEDFEKHKNYSSDLFHKIVEVNEDELQLKLLSIMGEAENPICLDHISPCIVGIAVNKLETVDLVACIEKNYAKEVLRNICEGVGTLRCLNIAYNNLGSVPLDTIEKLMCKLESLDMQGSELESDQIREFLCLIKLKKTTSLRHINLFDQPPLSVNETEELKKLCEEALAENLAVNLQVDF